jgi:hypothetical protein
LIWRAALWTCASSGEPRVVVEEGGEQRVGGCRGRRRTKEWGESHSRREEQSKRMQKQKAKAAKKEQTGGKAADAKTPLVVSCRPLTKTKPFLLPCSLLFTLPFYQNSRPWPFPTSPSSPSTAATTPPWWLQVHGCTAP